MMGAVKARRSLRLFFIYLSAWFYAWQRPAFSRMLLVGIWQLDTSESLMTAASNSMAA
jgi:hypothetical protein